jgi:hypothetical protein
MSRSTLVILLLLATSNAERFGVWQQSWTAGMWILGVWCGLITLVNVAIRRWEGETP